MTTKITYDITISSSDIKEMISRYLEDYVYVESTNIKSIAFVKGKSASDSKLKITAIVTQ